MTITTEQVQGLTGKVYSQDSNKVGSVGQIYLDDTTGSPSWVTVKTGLFGTSETFVPLDGARVDGDDVYVAFPEDKIKGAPRIDPDGSISPDQEDELYRYYGLGDSGTDDRRTGNTEHVGTTDDLRAGNTEQVGRDRSVQATDDAMTRSEERLDVGTATRESGRARLRKYVTTEEVTQTVPVSHEEVTLEREPITEQNADSARSGPAISEEEHEVTLHEEVPVVDKDVVAVERVKLGKETVTEDTTVSEEVRKENVEVVDQDGTSGKR